jgi:hypothetical protein
MRLSKVARDERTVAVENASYRLAYLVLSFGLLVSVAYRSFVRDETSWDLLGLVVLGGLVATLYQGSARVLGRRWTALTVAAVTVAVVLAALMVLVRR